VARSSEVTAERSPLLADRIRAVVALRGAAFHDAPDREALGIVERVVSVNFFEALGVRPIAGRAFVAADAGSQPPTVVLGHDLWRLHFGADLAVVGTTVELAGVRVHVAGIAPAGVRFPRDTTVWTASEGGGGPPTYARLAPGAPIEALHVVSGALQLRPLAEAIRPNGALAIAFLFGATALLLLVSWLQVGALLFARAAGRAREIGVSLALGASRARLLRTFAADGLVVAAIALALGWIAAPAVIALVVGLLPPEVTQGRQVDPDLRTLAFASAMAAAGVVLLSRPCALS
jgi:hypothetical protein